MARLKIGSGIQFKAELPKIEPSIIQKEEPKQAFDLMALVEQIKNLMPKEEPKIEMPDLSHIDDMFLNVKTHLNELYNRNDDINNRINNISSSLDHLHQEIQDTKAGIIIPEVKHITQVKDVSLEVLDQCKSLIKLSQNDIMLKVQDLQIKNKKQTRLNKVLGAALIITMILHLF